MDNNYSQIFQFDEQYDIEYNYNKNDMYYENLTKMNTCDFIKQNVTIVITDKNLSEEILLNETPQISLTPKTLPINIQSNTPLAKSPMLSITPVDNPFMITKQCPLCHTIYDIEMSHNCQQ